MKITNKCRVGLSLIFASIADGAYIALSNPNMKDIELSERYCLQYLALLAVMGIGYIFTKDGFVSEDKK